MTKIILTPQLYLDEMRALRDGPRSDDAEYTFNEMERLTNKLLCDLGYSAGVTILRQQKRW